MDSFRVFVESQPLNNILMMFKCGLFHNDEMLQTVLQIVDKKILQTVKLDIPIDVDLYAQLRQAVMAKRALVGTVDLSNDLEDEQPGRKRSDPTEEEVVIISSDDEEEEEADTKMVKAPHVKTGRTVNVLSHYVAYNPYTNPQPSTSRCNQEGAMKPLQSGRGINNEQPEFNSVDNRPLQYLENLGEQECCVKKFALTGRRLKFFLKKEMCTGDAFVWLQKSIDELLGYVSRGFQKTDIVGIVLESEEHPDKPLYVSFRKLEQHNSGVIMDLVAKVLQSNASFFLNGVLRVRVDCIRPPVGKGFPSATDGSVVGFNEFSLSKNSIYCIDNDDNCCLAGAIVVAKHFCDSGFKKPVLKIFDGSRGKELLSTLSMQLCNDAGVDLSNGGEYRHIQKFQDFLKDYTIVVYNCRRGKTVYFEGSRVEGRPCLNLLMENSHYNVILSLTGAFATSYFCERCRVRTRDSKKHKNCPYVCPCCHTMPPCALNNESVHCEKCRRVFRGADCLLKHVTRNLCAKLQRCKTCFENVWMIGKDKHICGMKYCQMCGEKKPVHHLCYIRESKLTQKIIDGNSMFIFIFYDFETTQNTRIDEKTFLHLPNLCVVQQVCHQCISLDNDDIVRDCQFCGVRQRIFRARPVDELLDHIAILSKKANVTAIAHNMKGFDGCFILGKLFNDFGKWQPSVVRSGAKLMTIQCGSAVRFIDSLNFIQLPLSKFPKTFKINGCKGYFPHLFNTEENKHYIGPLPARRYYGCDTMKPDDRMEFLKWYDQQVTNDYIFNMRDELEKYCVSDVAILRRSCVKLRLDFLKTNKVDPFLECITIASAFNLVFRRNFLKPNTIGIMPRNSYRKNDNQSGIAIEWLLWMAHVTRTKIIHAGIDREARLKEGLLVDGYCVETNTVYEFYGCWWHGCEKCFFDQTAKLSTKHDSLFSRRENTLYKEERIRKAGYILISIWECDFKKLKESNPEVVEFIATQSIFKSIPLNPRDAFFGGKLTFPLCRTCVETSNQGQCEHSDFERVLNGTYVSMELRKAVQLGYKIIETTEIWEYEVEAYDPVLKKGGLFTDYVNNFLKIKQECSDWPAWCKNEIDKERYIAEYMAREGVELDKNKISKNPGMRFLSKIMLNSFWGKFGQRENLQQTQLISDPSDLFKLVTNPSIIVHNITIINPELVMTTWDRCSEEVKPLKTVNVAIAAFTTASARLELYSYLEKLNKRVLYYDTDSVIFVHRPGDWLPPTGDFLGDLTDEMLEYGPGSFIDEFVSGGPKNYSFKYWNSSKRTHEYTCKVKGITLHYNNLLHINFEKMRDMVCRDDGEAVHLEDRIIVRSANYEVMTKESSKRYRVNYTKRRRLDDSFDTLPYGYN